MAPHLHLHLFHHNASKDRSDDGLSLIKGKPLINNPRVNKFTAFSDAERAKLGLRGLLPPTVESIELQAKRELKSLRRGALPIDKYLYLMGLCARNETLFYRLLFDNLEEVLPLIYTPTVGEACVRWSELTVAPRGLTISLNDLGRVDELLGNWGEPDVRAIVVTDGERILGLGDLGANGMGIPVGKLMIYATSLAPKFLLPVTLDVGTNNAGLRGDELYQGLRVERERGPKYTALVEEFMQAVKARWGPRTMVQFEDFGNSTAFVHLEKYRHNYCCFNDDIQGTAAVTLAAVYSSLRLTKLVGGCPMSLDEHVYVFLGAGEAGTGIAELIAQAVAHETGTSAAKAREKIWLVDSTGLVSAARTDELAHHKQPFAHKLPKGVRQTSDLAEIVTQLKATALIGVSAQPGTFTKQVVEAMAANVSRPVIFALSNPTSKAECTAQQAIEWTNGRCIFASGSPFDNVKLTNPPREFKIGQANNSYIFPGLALAVVACEIATIPDELLLVTAQALAAQVSEGDLATGSLFPPLSELREVSAKIAAKVAERAYNRMLAQFTPKPDDLLAYIRSFQYDPKNYADFSAVL